MESYKSEMNQAHKFLQSVVDVILGAQTGPEGKSTLIDGVLQGIGWRFPGTSARMDDHYSRQEFQ